MSRCNFDGWSHVIGEVPWCMSMQTTVRREAELESDPLWHVQPVQFVREFANNVPEPEPELVCLVTVITLPACRQYHGRRCATWSVRSSMVAGSPTTTTRDCSTLTPKSGSVKIYSPITSSSTKVSMRYSRFFAFL